MSAEPRLRSFGARATAADTAAKTFGGAVSVKNIKPPQRVELAICCDQIRDMLTVFASNPAKAKRIQAILDEPESAS